MTHATEAFQRPLSGTYHYENQRGYDQIWTLRWLADTVLERTSTTPEFAAPIAESFRLTDAALLLERNDDCSYDQPLPFLVGPGREVSTAAACSTRTGRLVESWITKGIKRRDGRLEVHIAKHKVKHFTDGARRESNVTNRYLIGADHGWVMLFEEQGSTTEFAADGSVESENDFGPLTWKLTAFEP